MEDTNVNNDMNNVADDTNTNQTTNADNNQPSDQQQPAGESNDATLAGGAAAPAEPVSYDFHGSVPEGFDFSQEESDKFVDVIRDMGLTNEQANSIVAYGCDWMNRAMEGMAEQINSTISDWGEAAKNELGKDFDASIAQCGTAMNYLEKQIPGIRTALNETGAGNRVEVIKAMAMVGRMLEGDTGKGAGGNSVAPSTVESMYPNTDFSKYK